MYQPQDASLDSAFAKLRRAKLHCNSYRRRASTFLKRNRYEFAPYIDLDGARHIYKAVNPAPVPEDLIAIVGDCVHNLRSVLDHLARQLVILSVEQPKDGPGGTCMIVSDKIVKVRGKINAKAQQVLDQIQPDKDPRISRAFTNVEALDNIDKHRHLHVIATGPRYGTADSKTFTFEDGPLIDGDIAATLTYDPPRLKPDPEFSISVSIAFGNDDASPWLADFPVDEFLIGAIGTVKMILDLFAPIF